MIEKVSAKISKIRGSKECFTIRKRRIPGFSGFIF